jgi:predicted RNA-binding Zn ribbon-like protein
VTSKELPKPRPLFIGGHPVLNFLNTVMIVDGKLVDTLQSNEDLLEWLQQAQFPTNRVRPEATPASLLRTAQRLRENIRSLTEKRKAGRRGDPSVLNSFLAASQRHRYLQWNTAHAPRVEVVWRQSTAASILAPVTEAAADFLATANFELIKRCEDKECVLWFADQTKSHQRRWCSMEICGNRHKVAAYRKRRSESTRSEIGIGHVKHIYWK